MLTLAHVHLANLGNQIHRDSNGVRSLPLALTQAPHILSFVPWLSVSLLHDISITSIIESLTSHLSYRSRQAVHEALALAARGRVRCHHVVRPLEEINRYVIISRMPPWLTV